jgi:hypothetical protein
VLTQTQAPPPKCPWQTQAPPPKACCFIIYGLFRQLQGKLILFWLPRGPWKVLYLIVAVSVIIWISWLVQIFTFILTMVGGLSVTCWDERTTKIIPIRLTEFERGWENNFYRFGFRAGYDFYRYHKILSMLINRWLVSSALIVFVVFVVHFESYKENGMITLNDRGCTKNSRTN